MDQWEYKLLTYMDVVDNKELNVFGKDGWEAYAATERAGTMNDYYKIWLKRKKP